MLRRTGLPRTGATVRLCTAVLVSILGLGAFSACSVDIVDRNAPHVSPTPTDTGPAHPDLTDTASYDARTTLGCPDNTLVLTMPGANVTLTTDCSEVYIESDGIALTAQGIDTLVISGDASMVDAETIDSVSITGRNNLVLWRDGTPTVTDHGTNNIAQQDS